MIRKSPLYADDLNTPLGQDRDRRDAKRPIGWTRVLIALLCVAGLGAVGWALYSHNPFGGESVAVVPTQPEPPIVVKADKPEAAPATTGTIPTKTEPPPGSKTITIIDGATGARREVVVPQ